MTERLEGRSALVIGGTAGIGEAIGVALATRGARVTVSGRNAEAGAAVVARMKTASGSELAHELARIDASSMVQTKAFADAFRARHDDAPLDFLVLCQSTASFGGRRETAEGYELKLALHAYSRFLLTRELLPCLRAGRGPDGSAGQVLSILSGGVHGTFTDWADPDLKRNFSLKRAADAAGIYNDLAYQHMADDADNEAVGFLHASPGFVASTWGHQTRLSFLIKAAQVFAKSTDECARVMIGAMCDDRFARGFHCVDDKGRPTKLTKAHTAENIAALQKHLASVYAVLDER